MKPTKRVWTRVVMGLGFALVVLGAFRIWSKHDFCQGWASHYASEARRMRAEAANPALEPDAAREFLVAAHLHDVISRKYAAVARQPWRSYPGYPLVTPEEQRLAAGKQ